MTSRSQKRSLKLIGIIGDPIAHSRSPAMQNAAFRKAGLPFLYLPFRVKPGELGAHFKKLKRLGLVGLNVTIPHKERIIRHLDRLSPEAKAIGAVNTLVNKNGKWIGYNTDGIGYLRSLREETGFRPRGKSIAILGAGGAARAVGYTLLKNGAKRLTIASRPFSQARRLTRDLNKLFPKKEISAVRFSKRDLTGTFQKADLLINATPIGWKGTRFKSLPLKSLGRRAVVSDLVYIVTPLLRSAKARLLKTHLGRGMLIHQGAEAFRLWTGRRPDINAMRSALS